MKFLFFILFSFLCMAMYAQDSLRQIEPGQETSFENYELLIIAVLGLLILIGLRFWFKRTRKH